MNSQHSNCNMKVIQRGKVLKSGRKKSFKTCMFWPVALVPMQIPFMQYKGADVLKDFKSFQFVAFSHKYIHMQYIYTVERYVAISY